jgi:hypothetical protein
MPVTVTPSAGRARSWATTDGGANWNVQNAGTTTAILGVAFVDAKTGWVVGSKDTILATTTGGLGPNAYQPRPHPGGGPATENLFGVAFPDDRNGFAIGSNILKFP